MIRRIKGNLSIHASLAVAGHAGLDLHASRTRVLSSAHVQRSQPLFWHSVPGDCGYEVKNPGRGVNVGSAGNSDFPTQRGAASEVVGHCGHSTARIDVVSFP